jgi:multiple sugar transport system permease protein
MNRAEKQNLRTGLLFTGPWIVGFLAFCVYPVACSVYYSLCDYSVLSPAVFVGARNYSNLLSDAVFWKALYNTLFFAVFAIPTGLAVSLFLAILLNFNVAGRSFFRTAIFLPSLVPVVSLAVLWQWILNGRLGLLNCAISPVLGLVNRLSGLALTAPNWLQDARYAKWGLVFASVWGVGNAVVIYLAALQDVPRHLYESAEIDGANFWSKTVHITLPVISPVIYFNTIMGLIGSLQVFAVPYVMTGGGDGPERSLLFVTTYLFQNAFEYWNMGYACAIGLILFLVILLATILATRLSERHIYYAGK